MVTTYHRNTINIPNSRCAFDSQYPMCFDVENPRAIYSHANNTYTLSSSNWATFSCMAGPDDVGECWHSSTMLAWTTIPIDADVKRSIIIRSQNEQEAYIWLSCYCGGKSFSDEYEVD